MDSSSPHHRRLRRAKLTGTTRSLGSFLWIFAFGLFFFVTVVLYSALDRFDYEERGFGSGGGSRGGESPSITIFTVPRPFELDGVDPAGWRQEMAVRSWLALAPEIWVVLFGKHPSVLSLAEALGPRVAVESAVDFTILKLGYNVLLSDVDVYWFNNPLPYLLSFGPGTLVAQSDEYNETGPINIPRRLNSGFYFVRSGLATIAAMEMVVKHASTSVLSEQPSFYDVLCGEGGVNRVGNDQCYEPRTNLTVFFLDRNFFPNGAYMGFWEKPDVRSACLRAGCFILHNNWINGRKRKLERQIQSDMWDYDPSTRLCIQSWHNYTKFVSDF